MSFILGGLAQGLGQGIVQESKQILAESFEQRRITLEKYKLDRADARAERNYERTRADTLSDREADQDFKRELLDRKTAADGQKVYRTVTGTDAKAMGLDPSKAYNVGPDGKVGQIGGGGVTINNGGLKIPTNYQEDPENPGSVIPIPGGPADPSTPTTTQRNTSIRVNSAATALDTELDNFLELIEKNGTEVWPGTAKDALLTSRRNIQLQAKELFNLGVLNGPDLKLMDELLIDPSSIFTAATSALPEALGGSNIVERSRSNIGQLKRQFETLRQSQTPSEQGNAPEREQAADPLGLR